MRVKLFTHTDLDGVGCAIVANYAFDDNVDVEYCDYHNVDQKVLEFINSGHMDDYDRIFITDISVSEEVAEKIEFYYGVYEFILLDHHPTAEWLNKYEWASIVPTLAESIKNSGTSMLYLYLSDYPDVFFVSKFVEKVRRYDTWEWSAKYNDTHAKELNDLLWLIGRDKFVERFKDNPSIDFTESERLILDLEQEKIDRYIESKEKKMFKQSIQGHPVGVVFAEQYLSQLGNVLATKHPELAFIVMIDMNSNKVSYRGIHDDIDLGEIAKIYSGGGHPKAAGSQFDQVIGERLFSLIFK